jgi:hypothetical protein
MRTERNALVGACLFASLSLIGCSGSKPPAQPHDAGPFVIEDGGPPVCTVDCHQVPDAGVDGGYVPQLLSITKVTPTRGPISGGTTVEITGTGFMNNFTDQASSAGGLSTLLVGNNPAPDYQVISDTVAEFTSPPNLAGPADVVLTNPNGNVHCNHCFTYFAPVLLQSISPTVGPQAGGTVVTLTGKGLTADTVVLFGDKASSTTTFDDTTGTMTATTPPGEQPGAVDVRIFNQIGTSSLRNAFRYQGAPRLTGSSPAGGPLGGGTVVTLTGIGLSDVTTCSFGATAGTQVLVQDDSTLFVTAPAASGEGPVDVSCTSPEGTATLKRAFVYFDTNATGFQLLGVSPTHGPASGGNTLTIVGDGLNNPNVHPLIGGQVAPVVSVSPHQLVVTVPPGTAHSTADVEALTVTLSSAYTYNVALQALRPSHGPQAGGTALSLDGAGFSGSLSLTIGGVAATGVTPASNILLNATSPANVGGSALVHLADVNDPEDFDELPQGFTYDETFTVGAVVPSTGAIAGGTYVTVFGAGFAEGTVVYFGQNRAKDINVVDSHTITCHTPIGVVGAVNVEAQLDTSSSTALQAFSYFDPTNQGGGSSGGPLDGTLNVTVLDSTLTQYGSPVANASVMLGLDPSTPFQGLTNEFGQITFSDPSIVKAQTVSVSKDGYEMVTVVEQNSQNLTVYIGQNDGNASSSSSSGNGPTPTSISGKVRGFKAPRPLGPNEREEARVFIAPHSLFNVDPLGYTPPPAPSERTVLNADGQTYSHLAFPGLYAVYAVYGIVDSTTNLFTPVLMGIHRDIEVSSNGPSINEDIVLDMHLDWDAPITILNPLTDPTTGAPLENSVYSYLDLGAEGVVPLGPNTSLTPDLLYTGLPELDGSNFIFLNYGNVNGNYPLSVYFMRQPGDPRQGLSIGPMLGLASFLTPSTANPVFDGTLSWSFGSGPSPDLTQVQIIENTALGSVTLWTVVLPGQDTTVSLPPTVMQNLLDRQDPGESFSILLISDSAPRFDYNHWSYDDLGELNWLGFNVNTITVSLPATDGGL